MKTLLLAVPLLFAAVPSFACVPGPIPCQGYSYATPQFQTTPLYTAPVGQYYAAPSYTYMPPTQYYSPTPTENALQSMQYILGQPDDDDQ